MPNLPECAWDAYHGLVVLYRDAAAASGQPDLALVVRMKTGGDTYFAGVFPACERIWALRAPTEDAFRLYFFSAGNEHGIADLRQAMGSLRFDAGIRVDPDAPLWVGEEVTFRLFGTTNGDRGKNATISERFRVRRGEPPRASVRAVLARAEKSRTGPFGIVAARSKNGVQGPSVDPLRSDGPLIDVCFTVVRDTAPADPHGLKIPGFEELFVPAIEVDLSAFGTAAEDIRQGFHFFHQALGSTGAPTWISGKDIPLDKGGGRKILRRVFEDCCHRDPLGVVFAGGDNLRARDDSRDGGPMRRAFGRTNCVAGMFIGPLYLPMPQESTGFAAMVEGRCGTFDMEAIERRRFCAWAAQDAAVAHFRADLRDAADACAFSLMAYLYFLRHLRQITRSDDPGAGTAWPDRLGLRFDALSDFLVRPDAAFAVMGDADLVDRVRGAFGTS